MLETPGCVFPGIATVAVCCIPRFQTQNRRFLRAKVFSALGCSGVIPIAHQIFLHYDVYHVQVAVVYMILMGAMYLVSDEQLVLWFPPAAEPQY